MGNMRRHATHPNVSLIRHRTPPHPSQKQERRGPSEMVKPAAVPMPMPHVRPCPLPPPCSLLPNENPPRQRLSPANARPPQPP
eukprot:1907622-Prymnesium_polylepis.1